MAGPTKRLRNSLYRKIFYFVAAPSRRYGVPVVYENENTGYQLERISKMMNSVARFHVGGSERDAYKQHDEKRQNFMWDERRPVVG